MLMNKTLPLLTLAILLTEYAAYGQTASHAIGVDTDSAQAVVTEWVAVVNANDAAKFLSFYDDSQETVVIVSSGRRHEGYAVLSAAFKDDLKAIRFYDSSASAMHARLLGDTAIVTFEHRFKIEALTDGSRWQFHVQTTSVLNRLQGRWRIVMEHSSPIQGSERMTRIDR